ncbi:MAG: DUF952 domain-containing protein [Pseudomonadota bacterium]
MAENTLVYKILSAEDWARAEAEGVSRTALDEGDGYVHLSTREQVGETLALHYAGAIDVRLLEFSLSKLGDVRWEPSRGGQLFPHLYGALNISDAEWVAKLDLGEDGVPQLPERI